MKNNLSKKLLVLLLSLVFIMCLFTVMISAEETEEHIVTETLEYKNGFANYGRYKKTCSCLSARMEIMIHPGYIINDVLYITIIGGRVWQMTD